MKVPITVSSSHEPAVTYYFRLKPRANSVLLETAARSNRRDEEEWSSLWQVKVPSKLRVFLWRLARHSLASADVFHHRNMADHGRCALCGASDSWRHSLLECNRARCVWALEREEIVEHLCELQEEDSRAWLANLIETMPHVTSHGWL